jgi:hypothetical protein
VVNKNICHFFLRVLFRKINSQKKLHKIRNPIHSIDYINAIKVVVRPWCGRHNSYGIFLLPINYNPERLILFNTIEAGKASRCWHKNIASQTEIAGLSIQSGYYPVRVYMQTRIALLLIIMGYKNKLKQPRNWQLTYKLQTKKND